MIGTIILGTLLVTAVALAVMVVIIYGVCKL